MQRAVIADRIGPVKVSVAAARSCKLFDPLAGLLAELLHRAELDRVGRAGLRAGRLHAVGLAVEAERTLVGVPVDHGCDR